MTEAITLFFLELIRMKIVARKNSKRFRVEASRAAPTF